MGPSPSSAAHAHEPFEAATTEVVRPSDAAVAPSLRAHGLLSGAADAAHYSLHLPDLRAAGALLASRGLLWQAALCDAALRGETGEAYVRRVRDASASFMDSQALYDRVETMGALGDRMGRSKGELVLFLGGKDLGKSHMLRELAARLRGQGRRAVIVNARTTGADLAAGIIGSLSKSDRRFFDSMLERLHPSVRATVAALANWAAPGSGAVVSSALAPPRSPSLRELLEGFADTCAESGTFPVLIIDEANRALPDAPGEEAKARTLAVLSELTLVTKEERRMNVVLAASEHAEPFRLAAVGFQPEHMTKVVIACEVPPAEMRALLSGPWCCGPALADGLMAVYGGHVWRMHLVLGDLAREQERFEAFAGLSPTASDGVSACVAAARSGEPHMVGLEGWLRALATHGTVAIPSRSDPRAELVSRHNVGGVVSRGASAPGVPREAWQESADQLLVASSQGMRLLLARALSRSPSPPIEGV